MTPDEVALRLRFRDHQPPCGPPDVDAFVRPAALPTSASTQHPTGIGVRPGRQPLTPRSSLVIFFQYASFGIPAIGGEGHEVGPQDQRRPDPSSWCIRPTSFGYLAHVPRGARGAHGAHQGRERALRRGSWIMAACLPLVVPQLAEAAPDSATPQIQRPQDGPKVPQLPAEPGSAAESPGEPSGESSGEPTGESPGESGAPMPPSVAGDAASQTVDPMTNSLWDVSPRPSTPTSDGLVPAIVDAAWEGVDGFEVVLELKGGKSMEGRVGAVQLETFTLIQAETGAVLVLPKSGVVSLRVRMPKALPERNGAGLLIGGAILTTISTPVFITGLTFLGLCPSCVSLNLPMLLIGGGGLTGGIPMMIRGSRYRRAYREALQEHSVAPVALRTRYGWTGGIRFRF